MRLIFSFRSILGSAGMLAAAGSCERPPSAETPQIANQKLGLEVLPHTHVFKDVGITFFTADLVSAKLLKSEVVEGPYRAPAQSLHITSVLPRFGYIP